MSKRALPPVQAQIPIRPDLQYCPRDGYKLVMQGLASIVRVAQSEDLKHALAAGQWLVVYGEDLMREAKAAKAKHEAKAIEPANREEILHSLRGLYAKALGDAPLIVETQAEPEAQPIPRD